MYILRCRKLLEAVKKLQKLALLITDVHPHDTRQTKVQHIALPNPRSSSSTKVFKHFPMEIWPLTPFEK